MPEESRVERLMRLAEDNAINGEDPERTYALLAVAGFAEQLRRQEIRDLKKIRTIAGKVTADD